MTMIILMSHINQRTYLQPRSTCYQMNLLFIQKHVKCTLTPFFHLNLEWAVVFGNDHNLGTTSPSMMVKPRMLV